MRKVVVLVVAIAVLAAGSAGSGGAASSETLKVGMVTDSSGLNDRGFNHLAYVGLQQAQKRLGITFRVAESRSSSDYIPNLAAFARQGYGLVIGVGYTEIGAIWPASRRTCSGCSSARSRSATWPGTSRGSRRSGSPGGT
jgi:basic membrane protein A